MSNEIIPEGYYEAVAVTRVTEDDQTPRYARFGASKEKKTKYVLSYFKILNAPEDCADWPLRWRGYFTKDTAKRTIESLRYMGLKGDNLATAQNQELTQIVSVKVEHEEHDDKVYAGVAWVNSINGGAIKMDNPMSTSDLKAFAAKMKGSLGKVAEVEADKYDGESEPSKPRPATQTSTKSSGGNDAPPPPIDDDDIPFAHCYETTMGAYDYHQPGGRAV